MKILSSTEFGKEAYRIIEKVRSDLPDEIKESVRSRCRSMYSYLFKTGILSMISFVYAKGSEDLVKRSFEWLNGTSKLPPSGEKEEVGYAIYGAFFCILFEKLDLLKKDVSLGRLIEAITSSEDDIIVIEDQALRFARWLKKFAEAILISRRS